MQFHDIVRQQVEHIVEALDGVFARLDMGRLTGADTPETASAVRTIGDVCELQEAQLQFAAMEFHRAVEQIKTNLDDIGTRQHDMDAGISALKTANGSFGGSFIDDIGRNLRSMEGLLAECANMHDELISLMSKVTSTVNTITGFVSDIEGIGHEIIQIALNARIKAACTGKEGDSLSALAEEIGLLSNQAVQRSTTIAATLTEIRTATDGLGSDAGGDGGEHVRLTELRSEANGILRTLHTMGDDFQTLLGKTTVQAQSLSREIATVAGGISVHDRARGEADEILGSLRTIFTEARGLYPASEAFKEDLRQIAQRYTMESERRIHEGIARRYGVAPEEPAASVATESCATDSEFGDNVELF